MTTIKSYTDIEQSKFLAGILPPQSADMYYFRQIDNYYFPPDVESILPIPLFKDGKVNFKYDIPCWSLAALLGVYPMTVGRDLDMYCCWQNSKNLHSRHYDNPIDACVEMIIKLNKMGVLWEK